MNTKFNLQVETIFKKFQQNTVLGQHLDEHQQVAVKRYFQRCWETGFAQGYAEKSYENNGTESETK